MIGVESAAKGLADLYITDELNRRRAGIADYRQEMLAILELAGRMADHPEAMLPRFVDLAMEITGAVSAGISLYEAEPSPGVFRWRYLRGALARFEDATTPRNFSPCGVTLDRNGPVLSRHPERAYDWIAEADIVVPEVLLVPVYVSGAAPLGTLWIVSAEEGHFNREHARAMSELASFVGAALRMLHAEHRLRDALQDREGLLKEMGHRLQNTFAVTGGLIRLSARDAISKDELVESFAGRLHALASAHSLVSRSLVDVGHLPRTGNLRALLGAVLAPHDVRRGGIDSRFSMSGPEIPCGDRALNGLALIFHELATNAAKYGALSVEDGRVEINWQDDGNCLHVEWIERGGPKLGAPPQREGFGSSLIKKTITGQFAGSQTNQWRDDGLTVALKLSRQSLNA